MTRAVMRTCAGGTLVLMLTISLVTALATGCSRASSTSVDSSAAAQDPAIASGPPLPDLTRSPASVRHQLTAAWDRLRPAMTSTTEANATRGEALGEMGRLLMAAEYYEAAEHCFQDALRLQPADRRWTYLLAQLYRLRHEPDRAVEAFERALRLQPDDVPTLVWLGTAYLEINQPDRAEPLFERALDRQPNLVSALYGLGRVALARKDYNGAVRSLSAALQVDPRASIVHYPLALAYRALGDLRHADAHMSQRGTTDIGPPDPEMQRLAELLESAPAYEFRGIRALERGQADVAADLFRRGLALEPNTASLRHRLGTMLLLLDDEAAAMSEFDRAMALAPDYAPTYYSVGVMHARRGRYAEAAKHFSNALTHAPDYLEARLALADMLSVTGRPAEALRQFDLVLDVRPQDAAATLGRAMALLNVGRQREAAEQLREGARQHPDRPEFKQALASVTRGRDRR